MPPCHIDGGRERITRYTRGEGRQLLQNEQLLAVRMEEVNGNDGTPVARKAVSESVVDAASVRHGSKSNCLYCRSDLQLEFVNHHQ
jgi:hypothetical protein